MIRFFTIYKTINLVNGNIYIGAHETNNLSDTYLGSGNTIRAAIRKHGRKNFKKEILMLFDSQEEMYFHESLVVNQQFIDREDTYNECLGGIAPPAGRKKSAFKKGYIPWNKDLTKEDPRLKEIYDNRLSKKGMTHEEIYGIEESKKIKQNLKVKRQDKTLEEIFGVEKAKEARRKNSESNMGRFKGLTYLERYGSLERVEEIRQKRSESIRKALAEKKANKPTDSNK